jgi:hypothetical protein
MPSLDKRVTKLEDVVETHLIESGEIRGDLKWLKKFMWFVLGSPFLVELAKHIHNVVGK